MVYLTATGKFLCQFHSNQIFTHVILGFFAIYGHLILNTLQNEDLHEDPLKGFSDKYVSDDF